MKNKNKKGFYLITGIILVCLMGAIGVALAYQGDRYCEHDSDCVLAIRIDQCCDCPALYTREQVDSDPDLMIYEEGKDYSSLIKVDCTSILCYPCSMPRPVACVDNKCTYVGTECTDSDGGRDYYKKGTVTLSSGVSRTDTCTYCTGLAPSPVYCGAVVEYYCEGNQIKSETFVCPNGCKDGACVSATRELNIDITSPGDGETVSGIVKVSASASGSNKLDYMYLTITGDQVAEHIKLTDCVWYCKPVCKAVGTHSEGWYDSCSGELIKYATCAGCTARCAAVGTKSENWQDTCNNGMIRYANCDKTPYGGYCTYNWDTSNWEGEKVTLTASISDAAGYKAEDSIRVYVSGTGDYVDVDVYPEIQTVKVGDLAEYKIVVTDNHPIARCGIALADNPTPTAAEIAGAKDIAPRCIVYYTYNLKVTGLPFNADYPESVTVYQGSSNSAPLTIKARYAGTFSFKVTATLAGNANVGDSDSATLAVDAYKDCNTECRRRGYDYGVCRTSCSANEYGIGTRYCPQIIDKTLTAAGKVGSTSVASSSGGGGGGVISVEKIAVVDAVPSIKQTTTEEQDIDIYMYPTYHCCCGNKGITVKAWPSKNTYESGETATIYAKVYSTGNGEADAEVTGTISRPDGKTEGLTFRKICVVAEIQKIRDENPAMEISCVGGECWPRCLYVATYADTDSSGYYSVKVHAKSEYGSAETTTGFRVRKEVKSCNNYCQDIGYDYGVCRTSCREEERNEGYEYCPQLIAKPYELTDKSIPEKTRYRYMYCCCGKLVPPPPPEEKIKLRLQEGWNLITLPGKGELSLGDCEALYGFVYLDGEYLSIKDAEEKLGEERLMEYLRKHSFWAYSFRECELEFKLEEYTSYAELEPSEGWNFLPITEDMIGKSLENIKGDCEFQRLYLWDAKKQRWEKLDPESRFSEKQEFKGFVVKAEHSCSLGQASIPSPPPLPD